MARVGKSPWHLLVSSHSRSQLRQVGKQVLVQAAQLHVLLDATPELPASL